MSTWKLCGACKKPIAHGATYWTCSVSTCNRPRFTPVFCSLSCWDSHVAVLNHRNAWANDNKAPAEDAPAPEPTQRRRVARGPKVERPPADVLVVASKLKKYIKDKSDMNTSTDVLDVLSDIIRLHADEAIDRARDDGRRTIKARDFRVS